MIKNPPASAGDPRDAGLIPRLGSSPGVGNGTLHQYSCLEESMGRGARQVTAHRGRKESDMIEQLSTGSVLQ